MIEARTGMFLVLRFSIAARGLVRTRYQVKKLNMAVSASPTPSPGACPRVKAGL